MAPSKLAFLRTRDRGRNNPNSLRLFACWLRRVLSQIAFCGMIYVVWRNQVYYY